MISIRMRLTHHVMGAVPNVLLLVTQPICVKSVAGTATMMPGVPQIARCDDARGGVGGGDEG